MPMPKKPILDKKVATAFSLSRRTMYAFREKCQELGFDSASSVVEELLKQFIRENTKL